MEIYKRKLQCLFLSVILITGCAQPKILDEIGLVMIIGLDRLKEDRIMGTFVLHQVDPNVKETVQVVSSTALTSKGIRMVGNRETAKKLVSGQLRVVMYSEELAREGFIQFVDTLARDPEIGNLLYLTVGKGSVKEILSKRYPEVSNVGTYVYEMIQQNIESEQMISATLHEFLHDFYSEGKDPLLPYIKKIKNEIVLDGAVAFNGDKMVGTLKPNEVFFVKLLRDRYKAGSYEITLRSAPFKKYAQQQHGAINKDNIHLVVDTISSESKIKLKDKSLPEFNVKIKLNARLLEISTLLDLSKPETIKELERQISSALEFEANKTIEKLKKMNSDPIGFGEAYRASVRNSQLSREKWHSLYPNSKINIAVDTTLIRTGIIE